MNKILLIDDEFLIRAKLKKYILESPFEVSDIFEASNGKVGLEIIKKHSIDLAIVDIHMPIINGLDFIKNLRSFGFNTKVIFLTGFEKFEYAKIAIKYSANDYLLKPVSKIELFSSLEKLLAKNNNVLGKNTLSKETSNVIENIHSNPYLENNLVISNIKSFIDTNYADNDLTLKFLSEKFHINSCHLSSTFKKVTSESLVEYITKKRISESQNLLRTTDLKISHIAEKVGYTDFYYFSKLFKKYVGMSPLKFKQLNSNS